ncbi:uncharacterized protein LOC143294657 [Babylonia areolata]|uniref:uncharacterized protein LOC143294657 n=1 Tax=Babylonia areolata TaxID=304850 RepID=UPI003FCF6377
MMETTLLGILCGLLACVTAGPMRLTIDPTDTCAIACKSSDKFSYRTGQTYMYDYTVQTETSVDGASEGRAALSISGQANIEVLDDCEMVLMLKNMNIQESSPSVNPGQLGLSPSSRQLSQVLGKTPLRFSFQDGVVESLCPGREEDPWALNIKRGVLSALQNSMDFRQEQAQTLRESDVTGTCVTAYEVKDSSYWGGRTTIRRRKDLKACTERQGFLGSLQTSRFQTDPSGAQSLPLMESEHECEQVVSEGIVQSAVCTENHLFRPFSAQKGGALTTVTQSLGLKGTRNGVSSRKDWIDSRAEMTFDHGYSMKDSNEARARAETLLKKLCHMTLSGVQPDVPRVFSQLVEAVRRLDSPDIRKLYQQLKDEAVCSINTQRTKKFFLDALPMAASSAAVNLMTNLMISEEVTGVQVDLYLAAMSFIPQPTDSMMDSVQALLETEKLKLQSMLAVSSMVHGHCQRSEGCSSSSVGTIMDLLGSAISYRCSVNGGNVYTMLTSLNAIGNTGQPTATTILDRCLGDRVPLEVRVAAAQAYRRLPCDVNRRPLQTIAEDRNEDNELRIMAYLQLMTCPSKDLLDQVQVLMETEPEDSQVSSFIHSHLSNLQETSSPLKQDVRRLLKDLDLHKLFHKNPLKFSRNYEKSAFLQLINSGGQAESNVIFSPQSPVPRSASLNLTVDVLGHSINLLEVGGRLEGVEYLVESLQARFFGSGNSKAPKNKVDELKGSGYARIFGNELVYKRFQGLRSLTSGKTFNLLDFLIKLSKDQDYSLTQSLQFLDSTLTTPTAGGLPLTLSVNGTATVDVKAQGKMDLRKVSNTPRNLHVEGEIRPSGAVNVDGVMAVDGLLTCTGVKVTSTMLSSTALKGRVQLDRGRTLSVQVDMPDDKMDILDIRTKFFVLHNEAEVEQKMITDNRKKYKVCTGASLSTVTGLEMCGELQFPNASMQRDGPYFPFTGPASLSLVLYKRDSHSGYKLLAKRVENKRSIAQLSFNTPGSSVVRAVSFDMMIDYPHKEVEITFASPWKKTSVKGSFVSEAALKSLTGSLVIDDDQTFSLTTELKVDELSDKSLTTFSPLLKLRRPGSDDITLLGVVKVHNRYRTLATDLTLSGLTRKSLGLEASYTNTQAEKGVSGTVKYGRKKYSAQAGFSYNLKNGKKGQFRPLVLVTSSRKELLRLDGQTDWQQGKTFKCEHTLTIPDLLDTPVTLKGDIKKTVRRKGFRYDVDVHLKSRPVTCRVKGFVAPADTSLANFRVDYAIKKLGRDRITLTGKFSNKSTSAFKKYTVTSAAEFKNHPDWNVASSVNVEHKKKLSQGSVTVKLGKNPKDKSKKITVSASLERSKNLYNYNMKALAPMLGVDSAVVGSHSHTPELAEVTGRLQVHQGRLRQGRGQPEEERGQEEADSSERRCYHEHQKYEVDSSLKQKNKELLHTLDMKTHEGPLLTMTSSYKPSKDSAFKVTSDVNITGYPPVKMEAMAVLKPKNLKLQAEAVSGKKTFSIDALSKISKGRAASGSWTPSAPGAAWASALSLSAKGSLKSSKDVTISTAKMTFTSPFTRYLSAALNLKNDAVLYGADAKVTLGSKKNSVTSTLQVAKPLSPGNVAMTWTARSPAQGWENLEASVDHVADAKSIKTVLSASKGKKKLQVSVTADNKSDNRNRHLVADIDITSTIPAWKSAHLAVTHKDDGDQLSCSATLTGGRKMVMQVAMNGNKKLTDEEKIINYALTIHSYRPEIPVFNLTLNHKMGDGYCTHQSAIVLKGEKMASAELDYNLDRKRLSGGFSLANVEKAGKVNIMYRTYPVTVSAELHMGPRGSILTDASFSKSSDYDMEGNLRMTTPFRAVRTITLTGSTSRHREDIIAKANLDYGVSQNYDASITFRPEKLTLARVVIHTPHPKLSSFDAGYQISGSQDQFSANADFSLQPIVDKYSASLNWQLDEELSGKLRINTPIRNLRYMQMTVNSKISGQGRNSRIDVEYYPRQMYALTSFYTTDIPIIFSLNAETPIQGYDSFGVSLKHEHDDHSLSTHGELQYLPDKVVESTLLLNWQPAIAGSLVVKTPFSDFEESKLTLRHDGELANFKSHAEMEVMHETMVADAEFKYGYTTTGSFSLESSMSDMEKIEATFNKRGSSDSFKSSASVAYGDQKMEGKLGHKLTSHGLKTSFMFNTPFTKVVKSSVDISNKEGDMQAIISGQYGPRKVDSTSVLQIDDTDFSASSTVNYNLDGDLEQQLQATASKKGDLNNLHILASFSSPYTEDINLSLQHTNDLPYSMKTVLSGSSGKDYTFESDTSFNHDPALSVSSINSYRMGGPLREASASFSHSGDPRDMSISASGKFGDKEISVDGEVKEEDGISSKLQINTFIPGYERVGMGMTHKHDENSLQQQVSLNYMTGKTIQYSINFDHKGLEKLQLDASLETPIPNWERHSLKLQHDLNRKRQTCAGEIGMTSSALGVYALTYKRVGSLEQMELDGTLDVNGEKHEGHMEWVPLTHGYKHTMELKSPREVLTTSAEVQIMDERIICKTMASLPPASISLEAEGVLSGFNAEINGKLALSSALVKNLELFTSLRKTGSPTDFTVDLDAGVDTYKITTTAGFKNSEGEVSGNLNIKTPFQRFENIGGSFKHSGDLNRFTSEGSILFLDNKDISGKVTFYRYEWMRLEGNAQLSTPFDGYELLKAEYRHAGSADSFTCSSSLQNGDSKISSDLRATLSPKYDITLTVKTPFEKFEKIVTEATLEKMANSRSAGASLDMGGGQRYTVDGSLDLEAEAMTMRAKLTTPLEQLPSVEISSAFQGHVNDFTYTLVFFSPQTHAIQYDSMLKYTSIFDVNAAVSVSSEIAGMQDLRLEMKNADLGNNKNGHVLLRWAPHQEVSLDGKYVMKDYWSNKEMQADITLTSPFQQVRSANLHVQHEQKDTKYAPKLELTVNGDSLVDVEGELTTGDNPSASVLTRSPRPTQVTAAFTRDGHNVHTDVFINWDRDQNDQHVRLQTMAKDIRDDYQTDLDYSLKVIHPSRTVSTGMTVLNRDQKVSSEGYLSLDDRADRRIFYALDYSHSSHYYGKTFDGNVKLGVPGRTLETSSSYSDGPRTSTIDASFSWDADRDVSKQVGVNAKVTKGERTKADLTLRLPAIGKEVHVDHEMALNEGRTVWDGKTAVSYSPDARRTLTLTSSLKDISDSDSSGKNYSLAVSISHPHTNTDITFTSHLGATGERLSAAMDTVYMTSRRTRKNLMLRGEIDQLRRQIDLQLDSPVKQMSMHGEVESTQPYVIHLTNVFDHSDVIQSTLRLDAKARSLLFFSNYDQDTPDRQLVVKAGYTNASALSGHVAVQQDGYGTSQEGSVLLRLDSPTRVHSSLLWRPQALLDLKDYVQRKTTTFSDDVRHTLSEVVDSTGQEVSEKYTAIAGELTSELSPLLDLVESELIRLGQQIDRVQRTLSKMYRRNDLHLKDMGQYALDLVDVMKKMSTQYQEAYHRVLGTMRTGLQAVKKYDIKQHYLSLIDDLTMRLMLSAVRTAEFSSQLVQELRSLWESGKEGWEQAQNHPHVQQLHRRVQRLGQDWRWLMGYVGNNVAQMSLPERYTSAIYQARQRMAERVYGVMNSRHVQKVKDVANEAYQQGVWAYKYWNVEDNASKHLQSLARMVGTFLREQLDDMTQQLQFIRLSNVTVYDPEQGRIELDLVLPVQLKSLQELPDLRAYLQEVRDVVDHYLPDKEALVQMYQKYTGWMNNTIPEDDMMSQFQAYKPTSRKQRTVRRHRRLQRL